MYTSTFDTQVHPYLNSDNSITSRSLLNPPRPLPIPSLHMPNTQSSLPHKNHHHHHAHTGSTLEPLLHTFNHSGHIRSGIGPWIKVRIQPPSPEISLFQTPLQEIVPISSLLPKIILNALNISLVHLYVYYRLESKALIIPRNIWCRSLFGTPLQKLSTQETP